MSEQGTMGDRQAGRTGLADILTRKRDAVGEIHHLDAEPVGTMNRLEMDRTARRIAGALRASDPRGTRAILALPPGPAYFAAFFGCVYAGVIPVPAPQPNNRRRALRTGRIVAACEATRIICSTDAANTTAEFGLRWDPFESLADGAELDPLPVDLSEVAYLQFTSGSTSAPRGVKISHGAVLANLDALRDRADLSAGGWAVSWLPLHHDMGLVTSLLAIDSDLSLAMFSPEQFSKRPWSWLEAVSRYRACFSGAPNFAFELLCRSPQPRDAAPLDLSGWTTAFCGAEPIRPSVMRRFAQRFASVGLRETAITPAYGLAEFTLVAAAGWTAEPMRVVDRPRIQDDTSQMKQVCDLGPIVCGHRLAIVEPEHLVPVAAGLVGEVLLDGPSKGSGYWGLEAESRETFEARVAGLPGSFLRTGDLGFVENGRLHIVGRRKELLILRGRNFHPEEIEEVARSAHPALRGSVAAFSLAEDDGIGLLCEAHRPSRGFSATDITRAIQDELVRALGINAKLIALVRMGSAPRTTSGKVRRLDCERMLAAQELPLIALWRANGEPSNMLARFGTLPSRDQIRNWVLCFLADRLGIDRDDVSGDQPLHALGLDSLGAVELAYMLEDWLRLPIEGTLIWQAPTFNMLCDHLYERLLGQAEEQAEANCAASASDLAVRRIENLSEAEVEALYRGRIPLRAT